MGTGMWTAASGAAAQALNLDTIANNLANTDSPAFKKDVTTFKEYLTNVEREHQPGDIPRGPIKDKDLYPLDGKDQAFVVVDGTQTIHKQGPLRVTQRQLDVALEGPGFLEVSTPQGIRYSRQGSLKMAADGRLVNSEGYPVLGTVPDPQSGGAVGISAAQIPGGPGGTMSNVAGRYVNLRDRGSYLTISDQGEIFDRDELVAKLSVVEFKNLNKLKKSGAQLFENKDPANPIKPAKTMVRQGVLEGSNVNPIEEMTNLINANRLFEQDLKSLKTYGELMGKEANEVGKL
ncbi:MAG: flagellar hook-basal body protein [Bdellovibrionia bacterium]